MTLSPAPGDLSLAEVSFQRAARGQGIATGALQVAVIGPFGDDYLAVAVPRLQTPGGPRALVLLVNRPSALLDPVTVRLRLTARSALGAPLVRRSADPFARPGASSTPALCNLPLHGSVLSASALRPLYARGQALAGFDAANALAQAYDVVCGLPYSGSFQQAVEPPSAAPPGSRAPGCAPCDPSPGYACPLVARPSVCEASARHGARRAAVASY
jgi:hypothetical protein